jgi:hypothetical protein
MEIPPSSSFARHLFPGRLEHLRRVPCSLGSPDRIGRMPTLADEAGNAQPVSG